MLKRMNWPTIIVVICLASWPILTNADCCKNSDCTKQKCGTKAIPNCEGAKTKCDIGKKTGTGQCSCFTPECCATASGADNCPACTEKGQEKLCLQVGNKTCDGKCSCSANVCKFGRDCFPYAFECDQQGKGVECHVNQCRCSKSYACGSEEVEKNCQDEYFQNQKCGHRRESDKSGSCQNKQCKCIRDRTCTQDRCQAILKYRLKGCFYHGAVNKKEDCIKKINTCYERCVDRKNCFYTTENGYGGYPQFRFKDC